MAAPGTEKPEKKDQASKAETPPAGSGATTPPPAAAKPVPAKPAPAKRKGGALSKLLLSAALVAILAGVAGYGALTFRDRDPRLGVAADYVEQGLAEAQGALDKAQGLLAQVTGAPPPAPRPARPALLDKAPLAPEPSSGEAVSESAPPAQAKAPEPEPLQGAPIETPAQTEKAPAPEIKSADVPEPPRRPAEAVDPVPPPPAPVEPPKPAPAAKSETSGVGGLTEQDLIAALEGRIEAMSDELIALRQKLDAPKSETRAAQETEVTRSEPQKSEPPKPETNSAADSAGAVVVLAFALQRELETGRPFAEEIAALSRLNAEPAPAPVLIELSEKGAATGPQLREAFLPLAKKMRVHEKAEAGHESDIAGHLLEGASKLVKVRPVGRAHPESLEGRLEQIEAALAHSDFAAADKLFEALPEEARAEAGDFGQTLRQRAEAAKAADDLLHGAIAALGKK